MVILSDEDRNLFEQYIFLPMILTVLNRDLSIVQQSAFKLKQPYLQLIEQTMSQIQQDLRAVKQEMHKRKMKVFQEERDTVFTQFLFIYRGCEERHNYFNPRIRNEVEKLMTDYLMGSSIKSH